MSGLVSAMDGLSKVVKFILAIPFLDIVWVVYRICRSVSKKDVCFIILGVVLLVVGLPFLWLVDMITICMNNKVLWFD